MPKSAKSLPDNIGILYHASSGDPPFKTASDVKIALAEVFIAWGGLEYSQLSLFVALMGSRQKLATEIFFRLNTRGTKADAIAAIAAYRLSKPEMDTFEALDAAVRSVAKERDKLAHWMYGSLVFHDDEQRNLYAQKHPGSFAIVDPRLMVRPGQRSRSGYVYTASELGEIRNRISKLAHHLAWMAFGVQHEGLAERLRRFDEISRELGVTAAKSHRGKAQSIVSK